MLVSKTLLVRKWSCCSTLAPYKPLSSSLSVWFQKQLANTQGVCVESPYSQLIHHDSEDPKENVMAHSLARCLMYPS